MKPRLLHIIPHKDFFPPRNGGALRCFYILRELSRHFDVHLLTLQPGAGLHGVRDGILFPLDVFVLDPGTIPAPRTLWDFVPPRVGMGIRYRMLRRSLEGPANTLVLNTSHLLEKLLRDTPVDAVVYEHWFSVSLKPLIERLAPGTAHILNAHNVDHLLMEQELGRSAAESSPEYCRVKKFETALGKSVDAYLCCSRNDHLIFEALNGRLLPGFVIPNGVDTAVKVFDENRAKHQNREILFCGALDTPANRDGLLWFYRDIWPGVRDIFPHLKLLVVGRGSRSPFLEMMADESVNFIGEVDDVREYYLRCALVVVPLRIGSGTRLKILEAMSMGAPVVSTQLGAEGIEVTAGTDIVFGDDVGGFQEGIRSLLVDQVFYDRIRHEAFRTVSEKYDWRVIGGMLRDAVLQVCSFRRHGGMNES